MHQRFSVVGLIFSILISTVNSTNILNNVLRNNTMNTNSNHSSIKMKTIFLNKKLTDLDSNVNNSSSGTNKLNKLNATRINNAELLSKPLKDTQLVKYPQKARAPRQMPKKSYKNNKEDTSGQHIKVILDLQSENEDDTYDYYDDYRGRNINGLIDDFNLNSEVEKNSKTITKTLNESQERKRCMTMLSPKKLQLPQKLLSENNENEKKSILGDANRLRSSTNSAAKPESSYVSNSNFKQIKDDDYIINILKQLIDKLNKSNSSQITHYKIPPTKNSNERASLGIRPIEKTITNNSSEEEWVLNFEKMNGNRIIDKLNSSPENTFVNGKWVRNKIKENNSKDCTPNINDLRSELNDKNESTLKTELKPFNLNNSESHVTETNEDISQKVSSQENKDISTSPPPDENEPLEVSGQTLNPSYLSSTPTDNVYSTMSDEKNESKLTTKELTGQLNEEDNFSNNEGDNKNDRKLETTLNNLQPTPNVEPNEELSNISNNASKIKNPDDISDSNDKYDLPNTNYSEGVTFPSDSNPVEKENISVEDNANCSCCKKVIKHILNSIMIKNTTEIKFDTYDQPNGLETKSHKRSDKPQEKNYEVDESVNKPAIIQNKNNLNSDLLKSMKVRYKNSGNNEFEEPKVNVLKEPTLTFDDDQPHNVVDNKANKNKKTIVNKNSSKDIMARLKNEQLNLDNQRTINKEKINSIDNIKHKRIYLTPKNLTHTSPTLIISKFKKNISRKNEASIGTNVREHSNVNEITASRRILTASKSPVPMRNKMSSKTSPQNIPEKSKYHTNRGDNITINSPRSVNVKDVPKNSKVHTVKNLGKHNDSNDVIAKTKVSTVPKSNLLRVSEKLINKTRITPRQLEKNVDHIADNGPNRSFEKRITESYKYNPITRIGKMPEEDHNNENKNVFQKYNEKNNVFVPIRLVKPSRLGHIMNTTNIKIIPKNIAENKANIYSTRIRADGKNNIKRIFSNKIDIKPKPTQSTTTSSDKSSSIDKTSSTENDDITSTSKSKKSLTDSPKKINLIPVKPNARTPTTEYSHRDGSMSNRKSTLSLKNKNAVNGQSSTEPTTILQKTSSKANSKPKHEHNSKASVKPKRPEAHRTENHYDEDYAPYKAEDLQPILFADDSPNKPTPANKNSRYVYAYPDDGWRPSYGNRLNDAPSFRTPQQSARIVRPECDDDIRGKNKNQQRGDENDDRPAFNAAKDDTKDGDTTDYGKYVAENVGKKHSSDGNFEVLPKVKVVEGEFKIPLVGRTGSHANGSEYISDILLPFERDNGRHSAISLTKLLTGDFHVMSDGPEENRSGSAPRTDSTQTSRQDRVTSSADSGRADVKTAKAVLRTGKGDEELTAPVHIIQIINNGLCPKGYNDTKAGRKSERDGNKNDRNGGKRISSVRSQYNNVPNSKKVNRKFEDAYNHFDDEILDRFLQVYSLV